MNPFAIVTGGAGFIGSHLCERLLKGGAHVLAIDNLCTGSADNVASLMDDPRFELAEHDVTWPLPGVVEQAHRVYNLACPADPSYHQTRPVQDLLTSVLGMWHLMERAQHSSARVLQVSDSELRGPRSPHDEGKRCAEAMAAAYQRQRGVPLRVARVAECYGPRQPIGPGRIVSNFVVQALRGDALTIPGDGRQVLGFCYVGDAVEGLIRLMESEIESPMHIGSAEEHSLIELAETVLRLTHSRSRLVRVPRRKDEVNPPRPDFSLAQRRLGWKASVALEEGLHMTIDHFRQVLDLPRQKVFSSDATPSWTPAKEAPRLQSTI